MGIRKNLVVTWTLLAALVLATSGCGYFLYPERRTGTLTHKKDSTIVMFDCLWLLAGIVPGAVALAVDGLNDTWNYTEEELEKLESNQRVQATVAPGEQLAVRLHGWAPADATVRVDLSGSGKTIASMTSEASTDVEHQIVRLLVPADAKAGDATLTLAINDVQQVAYDVTIVE